jgi:hypothetical protein
MDPKCQRIMFFPPVYFLKPFTNWLRYFKTECYDPMREYFTFGNYFTDMIEEYIGYPD